MVNLPGFPGFQYKGHTRPFLCPYKILVQCRYGKQRRNRHMILVHAPVGQYDNIHTVPISSVHFHKQPFHSPLQTRIFIVENGNLSDTESFRLHIFDLQKICIRQNRIVDL